MSKVYSFRLSEGNPREIKAREVIETQISQGYSLRQILTEALISFGGNYDNFNGMGKYLDQLSDLIRDLEDWGGSNKNSECNASLPLTFVDAVKKSAKQGIGSAKN